uniref:Uncharacterized protein n=1 Tax=Oryza punctata TaxID=4537 RepID=A0A0E0LEW3_ORYPU
MGSDVIQAKLVLLGDLGAGKTSIVESTIGAAFFSQVLCMDEATVKLDIWDTAGQERYHSLAPMYYRGAAAAVVVYDISSTDSYIRARKWVDELQRQGNPHLVMALVGNKVDLEEKRHVGTQEAMEYAERNGLFFIETSAKTSQNVTELFYELGKHHCDLSTETTFNYSLPDKLVKVRPHRPSGMVLHDGRCRRADSGGWAWRFCCSG